MNQPVMWWQIYILLSMMIVLSAETLFVLKIKNRNKK